MMNKQLVQRSKHNNLVSVNLSNLTNGMSSSSHRSHQRAPSTQTSKDTGIVKIDLMGSKISRKSGCDDVADEMMHSEGDVISSLTTTEHGEALSNLELH